MERSEIPHDPHHLGVPLGASKRFLSLWHVRRKTCSYLQTDRNKLPLEPRHLVVSSDASKTILDPMVHLAQTIHLSCTDTNTITKWNEERFRMPHVTLEFHRMHPKRCPSLWYVRRKPCTYLASRLALSPNGAKQAST